MRPQTTISAGFTLVALAALLLAACSPAPAAAPTERPPTATAPAPATPIAADPDQAVTSPPDLGTAEPDPYATDVPAAPWAPQPGDADLDRGNVYLDVTELAILESYPIQVVLRLEGNRPTPCHQLRVAVAPPDKHNQIAVEVYTVTDPGQACTQVLAPFNANIPLGSFPTGDYTVVVNGTPAGQFTA